MEPPAKRTKVGRAPHDAPADDNVNNGNKMNGNKGKKRSHGGATKGKNGDDEDDEIAMDPEDYAMKVDPEYRLDRKRANAENKLKSAFELLFEKYGQDFGDTGDEINFYTDEIEVDNGHIASLPVEQPSKHGDQGSDEESDEDGGGEADKLPAMSAAAKAASSRLVASLLPSRFGPGGTVIMNGGPPTTQGLAPGEIDPTWAAPELPDTAFSTPGGGFPFVPPPPPPPPRAAYAAPQPTVFTKALPTSYAGDLGEDGEDEEDDLIMGTPNPLKTKESRAENKSPSMAATKSAEAQSTTKRRKKTSSRPSTVDDATAAATKRTVVPDSQSSGLSLSEVQMSLSEVQSSAPLPASFGEEEAQGGTSSPPAQGSLPTPPDSKESAKPKETFKRNTVDPSFVFSDEEDFGLKKKKTKSQPKPPAPTLPASEPQEEAQAFPEEDIQAALVLDEDEVPLEAPVVEKKEQKRRGRGRPRRSGGVAEVATTTEIASEVTESYDLLEAQRREAQSLSIIIMTSSRPSSSLSTPAVNTAEPEVEAVPGPVLEAEPETEPTTAPIAEPVVEPAPESASEPEDELTVEAELEIERDVEIDDSTYAPSPPNEALDERPKKRKRRRLNEDGSSPLPSSQKSAKSNKSFKSSQKSAASSAKSKAGRRHTGEIPDSQSIGSSGIISLVSDGSADEAEIEKIAEASPRPFAPGSGNRQPVSVSVSASASVSGSRRGSPQTTPTSRNQTTPSSRRRLTAAEALMATPSRHRSHNKSGRLTPTASRLLLLSPLARRHQQMSGTSSAASSPGGSPVQTPGGTIRRCGKDGFRCEREFCFRCT